MSAIKSLTEQQPCLSCKKRRVKCDTSKPTCERCRKDDIRCPGYVRIKEWATPASSSSVKGSRSKAKRSEVVIIGPQTSDTSTPNSSSDSLVALIPQRLINPDPEGPLVFDSINYFNTQLVPKVVPGQLPFRRSQLQTAYWEDMPALLRQIMIITAKTGQAVENRNDPLTDSQLCHYRARGLAELKDTIGHAYEDSSGFILGYIILFMISDLQVMRSGSWLYHLEAARKVIAFRGGLPRCFHSLVSARMLIVVWMVVDTFSATMRPAKSLNPEIVETQLGYTGLIKEEEETLSYGYPGPHALLRDIIATTQLRMLSRKSIIGQEIATLTSRGFANILRSIENLDIIAWVNKVVMYGHIHPQRPIDSPSSKTVDAWISLGTCYKCAALLYLSLSCPSYAGEGMASKILAAKYGLARYSKPLFDIRSFDPDDGVETQLWKFLGWPLLISTYVRIGWRIGEETVGQEIQRLHEIADVTGRMSLSYSTSTLWEIARDAEAEHGKTWDWDAGLGESVLMF